MDNADAQQNANGKRKWNTGIMKMWLGTDPTQTAPDVEHRDPKAAIRAEQRKKRKVESRKPRPKPTFRVVVPAPQKQIAHQATAPGSSKNAGGYDMEDLIPFEDDKAGTTSPPTSSGAILQRGHIAQDGGTFDNLPYSAAKERADALTSERERMVEGMFIANRPFMQPPHYRAAEAPSIGEPGQMTFDGATSDARTADDAHRVERTENERQEGEGERIGTGHDDVAFADLDERHSTEELRFNSDWRRFGPQGKILTKYSPQYSDVPTVEWRSGLTTIAPYIPYESSGHDTWNKIKWDQIYVERAAKKLDDSRARPDLCKHAKFTTEDEAVELIRDCMSKGIPLVFDDFPASVKWAHACDNVDQDPLMQPLAWSQHPTKGVVGANVMTRRDFQDAARRELEEKNPYVTATLLEFKTWIKRPGVVRCILDLSCGFRQADDITDHLADNVIECMSNSFSNKYAGRFTIVGDMMKTQDWFLLHTSGFLTFGHIDASGMATSAQIRGGGMKEWLVFTCKNLPVATENTTRAERTSMREELISKIADLIGAAASRNLEPVDRDSARSSGSKKKKGTTAEIEKNITGDIRRKKTVELDGHKNVADLTCSYQPAGTVHAAYTPVPTAAAGKHFFTYDDLHRVELCRRIQMVEDSVTNHNHNCGVQIMLIFMAAAIPARVAVGQEFRRKPMIALALMLTRPDEYIPKEKKLLPVLKLNKPPKGRMTAQAAARRKAANIRRRQNAERRDEYDMTTRLRSANWAEDGTAFDRLAYAVACRILEHAKTGYAGDKSDVKPGPEYIMEGRSWDDPGPVFDMVSFTEELMETHIDDIRAMNDDAEAEQLAKDSEDEEVNKKGGKVDGVESEDEVMGNGTEEVKGGDEEEMESKDDASSELSDIE